MTVTFYTYTSAATRAQQRGRDGIRRRPYGRGTGGGGLVSKLSGYDDRSLVSASVSRLARVRPKNDDGGKPADATSDVPESIWKGNDPSPLVIVDDCDATDIARDLCVRGGGESDVCAAFTLSRAGGSRDRDRGDLGSDTAIDAGDAACAFFAFPNDCCASGERGGVRIGRLEIGDGGTKGKLSKMESARVSVDTTEDIETRLLGTPSTICSIARAC